MRDDIHRRLPLPPRWKRLAKSCARDSDADLREERAIAAIAGELSELSPADLRDALALFEEEASRLFPDTTKATRSFSSGPASDELRRQCQALRSARLDPSTALRHALIAAVAARCDAQLREAKAHLVLEGKPRDARLLYGRMDSAVREADLDAAVDRFLELRAAGGLVRRSSVPFDLDRDLRGPG